MRNKSKMPKQLGRRNKIIITLFLGFLIVYCIILAIRSIQASAFFDKQNRINILFYSDQPVLLSFGLTDDVNYIVSFTHEDRVDVPGGYDRYAVGALGRLSDVENDRYILQRAFSSMTSAYIDYFVAPKKNKVYDESDFREPQYKKLVLIRSLFSPQKHTNANIFDKIYLLWLIIRKREGDFVVLKSATIHDEISDQTFFSEQGFQKKYKGFFYHQALREEGRELQILYRNYNSAYVLSRVIEGQGIRVVDLSQYDDQVKERCVIKHNIDKKSKTILFLQRRFQCEVKKANIEGSDIIFLLGNGLEKEWE
ncbi:hypothetical protein A3H80_01105 [Candidatus Roizmanbacteria bacterium RIFCSPLOWO2_02_FULL_37_19]|nr:MAG: hypothetical protein A2956_04055 [Candidatus Roizmanbacteria bacterium RIFCSPLOWO2_01_FULL_37_57]OGK54198.1 MAG: hypothetical protein A3H80_01105 [Candidatus Roizmanbacteria bacterium RIFCSPLOWO2_02_FULL_37_19]